ncbi:signal peptide peptidase-domain-containing protein [Podospora conica]|nr:signal peptide peptidase-domain-containing protein [Schizothecium conicum]
MASTNTTTATLTGESNITAMAGPNNSTETAPPHPFHFSMLMKPEFLLVEAQVIFSALSIIWLGAHASLRRPPSAAHPKPKNGKKKAKDVQFAEGFTASDVIMIPVMASAVLVGLYYALEWLKDPDILNRILRVYLSTMSIASLGAATGHALDILTSLVFPGLWVDRKGTLFRVDPDHQRQMKVAEGGVETEVVEIKTPFPSFLSTLPLSPGKIQAAWEIRNLLTEEWTVRLAAHGLGLAEFNVKLNTLLGFLVAIAATIAYNTTKWFFLPNLLASAVCYESFSLMSPTSFSIGSSIMAALFFYDIIMVFYTPYMITVAKKIDAPIKLVFNTARGVSMLGLGDIVIPGILMAMALRFDLHQFYLKQTKQEPISLESEFATRTAGETITFSETQYRRIKPTYVNTEGQWGNRFWTTRLGSFYPVSMAESVRAATAFPKPYFYASVFGYFAGMVATLTMLVVFKHGQPALLYLVPGVTGSLWLTALVRGELKEMYGYTEDGSMDVEDVVVEVDSTGNTIDVAKTEEKGETDEDRASKRPVAEKVEKKERNDGDYDVFLFAITAPRRKAPKRD